MYHYNAGEIRDEGKGSGGEKRVHKDGSYAAFRARLKVQFITNFV